MEVHAQLICPWNYDNQGAYAPLEPLALPADIKVNIALPPCTAIDVAGSCNLCSKLLGELHAALHKVLSPQLRLVHMLGDILGHLSIIRKTILETSAVSMNPISDRPIASSCIQS